MSKQTDVVVSQQNENYTQLCVWPATIVGQENAQQFEEWFKEKLNTRIKYKCEVKTLADVENGRAVPDTGGRNDAFFYVHCDDIANFALPRLTYGIRWWEDVIKYNDGNRHLYTEQFLQDNPPTW